MTLKLTLKQLAKEAEAAEEKAWAAWQQAIIVAHQARVLAYELIPLEKVEEKTPTWNPIGEDGKYSLAWAGRTAKEKSGCR